MPLFTFTSHEYSNSAENSLAGILAKAVPISEHILASTGTYSQESAFQSRNCTRRRPFSRAWQCPACTGAAAGCGARQPPRPSAGVQYLHAHRASPKMVAASPMGLAAPLRGSYSQRVQKPRWEERRLQNRQGTDSSRGGDTGRRAGDIVPTMGTGTCWPY